MRERERERQRHRRREKQAPCRKPDVGLDPGTPGSRPRPKAGAKPLSHPGIPRCFHLCRTPGSAIWGKAGGEKSRKSSQWILWAWTPHSYLGISLGSSLLQVSGTVFFLFREFRVVIIFSKWERLT